MIANLARVLLLAVPLSWAGCSDPVIEEDTAPPVTAAYPGGGTYGAVQYVTLAGDEAATVHYALEGPLHAGHPAGGSSENPVYWIRIGPGTTTLRFFAIDRHGNREATRSETYVIEVPAP